MNTPEAIAKLHAAAGRLNKALTPADAATAKGELLAGGRLLGILESEPEAWFTQAVSSGASAPSADEIEDLIQERLSAREQRDFARADEIRTLLDAQGVVLEDGPEGTIWRRRH